MLMCGVEKGNDRWDFVDSDKRREKERVIERG